VFLSWAWICIEGKEGWERERGMEQLWWAMNASTYEAWKDAPQAKADSSMRGKRMGHKIALVQQQLVLRIENRESRIGKKKEKENQWKNQEI
jgi:hypothetical protein